MAIAGPAAKASAKSLRMVAASAAGKASSEASTLPRPLLGLAPTVARASACCANTGLKNARTACPKRMGSDTFIIVAFKCRENNTPDDLASATCCSRNSVSAAQLMNVASAISPANTATFSFMTVTLPSAATCSMRKESSCPKVTDCSLERKSPPLMCATCEAESGAQAPIECGLARA